MNFKDLAVFNKNTTATIAAGNYGAPFTHIDFLFYKPAYLVALKCSFELWETAAGWRVYNASNAFYLQYQNPSSPYLVGGQNDWPYSYTRASVTIEVNLGLWIPANELIYLKSDVYLEAANGKDLTAVESFSLFYIIP